MIANGESESRASSVVSAVTAGGSESNSTADAGFYKEAETVVPAAAKTADISPLACGRKLLITSGSN